MHASLQRKFSFSYIAIILAVLILLNTYPLITSENLTFRSKQSSLQGSVSVMVTALSGLVPDPCVFCRLAQLLHQDIHYRMF